MSMASIDELYVYCFTDGENETVAAFKNAQDEWIPMIAASQERFKALRPVAHEKAASNNQELKLLKFSQRTVIGIVEPGVLLN